MKRWNGLLKKEWLLMRSWLRGTVILSVILIGLSAFGLSVFVEKGFNFIPIFGFSMLFFVLISLFLPVSILLNSLWKEWKQSDVWLHSTSSAFQLFGAKVVFAATCGAVIVFMPALLFLIYVSIFGSPVVELSPGELRNFVVHFVCSFYTASIMIMVVGLLIGVFYQLMKPVMKGFTVPIIIVFFLIVNVIYEYMKESSLYQKVATFGPIGDPSKEPMMIERENFFMGPIEPVVYTGDVLLSLLFIIILFVTSVILFEKKVRL